MRRVTRVFAATLLGAGLAAAPMALAQGPGPGMTGGMMGGTAREQGWLETARHELGIRPGQEKAWAAYAGAVRDEAQAMRDMHAGMDPQAMRQMTPDQRRQVMQGMHASHAQQAQAVDEARARLFSVLDENQRRVAARLLTRPNDAMMGGMGGGMRGGGMRGGGGMMGGR